MKHIFFLQCLFNWFALNISEIWVYTLFVSKLKWKMYLNQKQNWNKDSQNSKLFIYFKTLWKFQHLIWASLFHCQVDTNFESNHCLLKKFCDHFIAKPVASGLHAAAILLLWEGWFLFRWLTEWVTQVVEYWSYFITLLTSN